MTCPYCSRINEWSTSATNPEAVAPKPGDIALCIGCAGIAIYTVTGVRLPTRDEHEEALAKPAVRRALAVLSGGIDTPDPSPNTLEALPCGCQIGTDLINGTPTFLFLPHALDCEYFRYVLDEAAREGKPVTTLDAR
jgi:hypothetical protein